MDICFADVKRGDVVYKIKGQEHTITQVGIFPGAPKSFWLWYGPGEGQRLEGEPNEVLGLVRRSWLEGRTAKDMLDFAEAALKRCANASIENDGRYFGAYLELRRSKSLDSNLCELLRTLEEYELGKPAKTEVLGVSSDPVEAAIDASCGYLGGGPNGC